MGQITFIYLPQLAITSVISDWNYSDNLNVKYEIHSDWTLPAANWVCLLQQAVKTTKALEWSAIDIKNKTEGRENTSKLCTFFNGVIL